MLQLFRLYLHVFTQESNRIFTKNDNLSNEKFKLQPLEQGPVIAVSLETGGDLKRD